MPKSLLQILTKPLGYKKAGNPLKWPMKPHPRETDVRDFLSTLEITAQDEPAGNDDAFSAKDVKVYDRKAHRHGHDNIDFNDLPPKSKFFTMEESEEEPTHSVTFQRGTRVGTRSHHYEYVTAKDHEEAVKKAKKQWPQHRKEGYRVVDSHDMREWGKNIYEGLSDSEPLSTGQVTTKAKKPLRKIVKETLDEIKRSPHDLLQKQIYHGTSAGKARSIADRFALDRGARDAGYTGFDRGKEGYNRWTRIANNHNKARLAAAKLERQEKTKLGIKD